MGVMAFEVCRRGRDARWIVRLRSAVYGSYLDKEQALLDAVYDRFEPNVVLGFVDPEHSEVTERMPFLQERPPRDGRATAYVCEYFACLPPVHEPEALLRQLEEGTGISWRDF